ncbi:MAG TPA: hypothetical protein VFO54_05645, partial [Chryseosolibacter sp.]|nr:hypothetical protein [Chryseosolibacter sp.]
TPSRDVIKFGEPHCMKQVLFGLLLVTGFNSCSTNSQQVATQPPADSTTKGEEEAGIAEAEEQDPVAMIEAIQLSIENIASDFDEADLRYYTLHSSFSGYENSMDSRWLVDSLVNAQFCEVNWGMESTSGSYSYYFDGHDIVAGEEKNYYNDYEEDVWISKGLPSIFGFSKTNGTENDSIPSFLHEADYASKNEKAREDFYKLIRRIRELSDSAIVEDEQVTIVVETIANYGEDFTETEKHVMNKNLFELIIKD